MAKSGVNQVLLPWPPAVLSPNARPHWAAKSKAAKAYRRRCFLEALAAKLQAPAGRILLSLEFLPPNKRRRDDDNLVAAFKSGRDGLAEALRVDDSVFVTQISLGNEVYPGGAVRVTLSQYEASAGE